MNRAQVRPPREREILGGLAVLLVCAGVLVSRGGTPERGYADTPAARDASAPAWQTVTDRDRVERPDDETENAETAR